MKGTMKAILTIALISLATLVSAGPINLHNADSVAAMQVQKAIEASADYASTSNLIVEATAANNATKLQAVLLKILKGQELTEKENKKAKDRTKKDKATKKAVGK